MSEEKYANYQAALRKAKFWLPCNWAIRHLAIGHSAIGHLAIEHSAIGILAIGHLAIGTLAIGHSAIGISAINVNRQSSTINPAIFHYVSQ